MITIPEKNIIMRFTLDRSMRTHMSINMDMGRHAAVIMITTAAMDMMMIIIMAKPAAVDTTMEAAGTVIAVTDIIMRRWSSVR